jgi:hypothetical protein
MGIGPSRLTRPSKKPRNASRCWLRLAGEPPRPTGYWPTAPGVIAASSTPLPLGPAQELPHRPLIGFLRGGLWCSA